MGCPSPKLLKPKDTNHLLDTMLAVTVLAPRHIRRRAPMDPGVPCHSVPCRGSALAIARKQERNKTTHLSDLRPPTMLSILPFPSETPFETDMSHSAASCPVVHDRSHRQEGFSGTASSRLLDMENQKPLPPLPRGPAWAAACDGCMFPTAEARTCGPGCSIKIHPMPKVLA